MTLEGKVALLVGGGGGIGVASAIAMGRAGATVVVADIDEALARAAAERVQAIGGECWSAQIDALDEERVEALLAQVIERHGRLDVLQSLPSTTVLAPSTEIPIADLERVLRTTVVGQFLPARVAARHMIELGHGGSIILMSSIGGLGGLPRRAAYTASAGAIVQLTRTLAVEWALHAIRVNAIAPAWTLTDALLKYKEQFPDQLDLDALAERIPMGRLGMPEEIGDVAAFLASDASRFVTGVTLPVDGGVVAYIGPHGRPSAA